MKTMKKLLSILMVLTLVLSLGATALAATVTIGGRQDKDSEYYAYQLMTAKFVRTDGEEPDTTDVYEYHLNEQFLTAIAAGVAAVGGDMEVTMANENAVIEFISNLSADLAREFADAAYMSISKNENPEALAKKAEMVDGKPTFTGMEGYYLIAEKVSGDTENAVTSLVMLDTIGKDETIEVVTKEEVPSSEKKVQEKNDSTGTVGSWQDAADYDIDDDVPFQITGTLPMNYDTYDKYQVVFHDKESAGLTFVPGSVKVTIGNQELTEGQFSVATAENGAVTDGCTFEITIDVKDVAPSAENGSTIVVNYYSKLNEMADIGAPGNPNEMRMEYTNDHYSEGTGKTPWDKVTVFTFELDVKKVDGVNEPLTGAGFTLWKLYPAKDVPQGATTKDVPAEEGEGTDPNHKWVSLAVIGPDDNKSEFTFGGLDSGEYLLEETTIPTGYNGIDPIRFTVEGTYEENNVQDPKLTDLKIIVKSGEANFTVQKDEDSTLTGVFSTDVMNLTGVELPETGGIGTTIFYVAGALLVAAAVVLLVTKRRVNGAEK